MPDSFSIPHASPLGWVIDTGAGAINAGAAYYNNELYPKNGAYKCGESYPGFCQPFDCNDVIAIQVVHDDLEDINKTALFLELYDDAGALLDYDLMELVTGQTIVKQGSIDMGSQDCPSCYQLKITGYDFDAESNLWTCGGNGLFETAIGTWGTSTGPTNTISKDTVIFWSGAASAKITAGGAPGALDERIIYCAAVTLAANTIYEVSAYVREDVTNPWDSGLFKEIYFEILSGLSDATIISETRYDNTADGPGNWTRISVIFKVGSDTSAQWLIRSTDAPDATGIVNVDAVVIDPGQVNTEAESQWICLDDLESSDCHKKIVYYNNGNTGGMVYDQGLQNFFWAEMNIGAARTEDPLFSTNRTSAGVTSVIKSQQARIVTAWFDVAPEYFHQIIAAASKSDVFTIDGYSWHPLNASFQPDYEPRVRAGMVEMELIDKTFSIDKTYC